MIGIGSEVLLTSHNKTSCLRNITEYDYRIGHVGLVTYQMNGNDDMFSFDYSPYYHKDDFEPIIDTYILKDSNISIYKTKDLVILKDIGNPFNIILNKKTISLLKERL